MKYNQAIAIFLLAIAVVSCSKEDDVNTNNTVTALPSGFYGGEVTVDGVKEDLKDGINATFGLQVGSFSGEKRYFNDTTKNGVPFIDSVFHTRSIYSFGIKSLEKGYVVQFVTDTLVYIDSNSFNLIRSDNNSFIGFFNRQNITLQGTSFKVYLIEPSGKRWASNLANQSSAPGNSGTISFAAIASNVLAHNIAHVSFLTTAQVAVFDPTDVSKYKIISLNGLKGFALNTR